jgi:hypothetical protein
MTQPAPRRPERPAPARTLTLSGATQAAVTDDDADREVTRIAYRVQAKV